MLSAHVIDRLDLDSDGLGTFKAGDEHGMENYIASIEAMAADPAYATVNYDVRPNQHISTLDLGTQFHISLSDGNEVHRFQTANDYVYAAGGNDVIFGGIGHDVLSGGDGDDTLYGEGGHDTFYPGKGNDKTYGDLTNLLGDFGRDSVIFEGNDYGAGTVARLVVDLEASEAVTRVYSEDGTFLLEEIDEIYEIEEVRGTSGDDLIRGTDAVNFIVGLDGNDTLDGRGGRDYLHGDEGDDLFIGGAGGDNLYDAGGNDTASYETAEAGVIAGLGSDFDRSRMTNDAAGDGIYFIENLIGSRFDDELYGDELDNHLTGLAGADILDGGEGLDTASYAGPAAGVNVNLAEGTVSGGDAEGDTLVSIENLIGSAQDDRLLGDGAQTRSTARPAMTRLSALAATTRFTAVTMATRSLAGPAVTASLAVTGTTRCVARKAPTRSRATLETT